MHLYAQKSMSARAFVRVQRLAYTTSAFGQCGSVIATMCLTGVASRVHTRRGPASDNVNKDATNLWARAFSFRDLIPVPPFTISRVGSGRLLGRRVRSYDHAQASRWTDALSPPGHSWSRRTRRVEFRSFARSTYAYICTRISATMPPFANTRPLVNRVHLSA